MAPVDEIEHFITQKSDYSYGVYLLSQIHKNKRLIQTLLKKESNKNWEKLVYELQRHHERLRKHTENVEKTKEFPHQPKKHESSAIPAIHVKSLEGRTPNEFQTSTSSATDFDRSNSPVFHNNSVAHLIEKVKAKRIKLYRSRGHLHGRLHEARTKDIRKQLARDIIDIQKEIESVNKDLQLIEEGKLPKELVLKMMDGATALEYRNVQNYVVRYRNYLKKSNLTEDQKQRYQSKFEEYSTKLENYFKYV